MSAVGVNGSTSKVTRGCAPYLCVMWVTALVWKGEQTWGLVKCGLEACAWSHIKHSVFVWKWCQSHQEMKMISPVGSMKLGKSLQENVITLFFFSNFYSNSWSLTFCSLFLYYIHFLQHIQNEKVLPMFFLFVMTLWCQPGYFLHHEFVYISSTSG